MVRGYSPDWVRPSPLANARLDGPRDDANASGGETKPRDPSGDEDRLGKTPLDEGLHGLIDLTLRHVCLHLQLMMRDRVMNVAVSQAVKRQEDTHYIRTICHRTVTL
jgi:hypothetical protein